MGQFLKQNFPRCSQEGSRASIWSVRSRRWATRSTAILPAGARPQAHCALARFNSSSMAGSGHPKGYPSHIPFGKFGSLQFLDAAYVKDVLALLRFVENPRDRVAVVRILQR